ncbi:MAG: hypothetical protein Q8J89_07640 [Caulobacter sp.]|nr:hypothetical protein [Caulobacter sp.]
MFALIALMLAAADAPRSIPVRLEDPATITVRFKTVKDEVHHNSFMEGAPPRETHSEKQHDFCVVVRRADLGFLADWRPLDEASGGCPAEPGYVLRTDAALAPSAFENWLSVRQEVLASSELTPGARAFFAEMDPEAAMRALVEPAFLLALGQGAGIPPTPEAAISWSEPVEFRMEAPGQGAVRRRLERLDASGAIVSWSLTAAAVGEVRRDFCRYHIDLATGLAKSMHCRLETELSIDGEVFKRETRLIDLTQTLSQ